MGEWIAADSGGTIAVDNPSTGAVIGHVPNMGAAEARRAIEFANAALRAWRARTAKERAGILRRWFDLMMANQDDLGAIMTAEQGKPFTEAKGEIAYAASFIEWFGEGVNRGMGDMECGNDCVEAVRRWIGFSIYVGLSSTPITRLLSLPL